jgi:hypothetical protein
MHTTDSPEKGRATGAQSRRRGNNENSDSEQILDRALQGNCRRMLIGSQPGIEVWEIFTISSHFEVRTADQQWVFAERWDALNQEVKIANSLAAKEGVR